MRRRLALLTLWVVLASVLATLTPLAYATPSDPTWVSGFFDDDDNDNGVFFITSSTATLDPLSQGGWTFFPASWPTLAFEDRSVVLAQYFSPVDVRGPPAS